MDDMRITNRRYINNKPEYVAIINEMESTLEFVDEYGFLTYGRDNIFIKSHVFSLQNIMISVELTISNIIDCCKNCCFADANTLLRKYRDDLFFSLYIVVYDSNSKADSFADKDIMEKNIDRWLNNNLINLQISDIFKQIGKSPMVSEAVQKYNLKKTFAKISDRLNNYVHGNGYVYYNRNVNAYNDSQLLCQLMSINNDLRYITTAFLFLLILCSPLYIMATDYIDYLDCGQTPPDGSQYLVAPFVESFIRNNISLLGDDCYKYLKDNTYMNLEQE